MENQKDCINDYMSKDIPANTSSEDCMNLKAAPVFDEDDLDLLKRYPITFDFADVGCIIQIGCKRFCFSDNIVALDEFSKYVKKPKEAYSAYLKNLSDEATLY